MNIKDHFKNNKKFYIGLGVGVGIAGITCLIMRGRHAGIQRVPDGPEMVTVRPLGFLSVQNTSVVSVFERNGRGHPGYMVRDLDTNLVYESQKATARALDTYPSIVSGHLNGKLPDVNGHHLERVIVEAA